LHGSLRQGFSNRSKVIKPSGVGEDRKEKEVLARIGAAPSIKWVYHVSRSPHRFTRNEVKRLMRLADDEGVEKYQIAIAKTGELTLTVDNTVSATEPTEADPNIWDEVLNAAHKKRSA
jgi:hypothetical protein